DDDVLRSECALPILAVDLDLAVAGEAPPAGDVLDLVLLEQEADTLGALRRDLACALRGDTDVQLYVADRDAVVLQRAGLLRVLRALEHRLRRDAAGVVADAAQSARTLTHLDACDAHAELRTADRG